MSDSAYCRIQEDWLALIPGHRETAKWMQAALTFHATQDSGGGSDLWDHKAVALKAFLSFTGFNVWILWTGLFLFSLEINYEFCFCTF
jgi:hypothetical protein